MKFIRSFCVLLWRVWFALLAAIGVLIVAIPLLTFIWKEEHYPKVWQLFRFWGAFVFYGSGMRYELEELEDLNPNQSYVFMSNHTSLMDIPLFMILCKKHNSVFIGKEELAKYPLFGLIYRRTNILVNRADKNSRMQVFRQAKKKVNLGRSIIIFPEGGVPDDESIRLDKFKDGAFAIAISNQIPIVVYTVLGMKERFPYSYFRGKPGKVNVILEKIIPTEELSIRDKEELKNHSFQIMDKRLYDYESKRETV